MARLLVSGAALSAGWMVMTAPCLAQSAAPAEVNLAQAAEPADVNLAQAAAPAAASPATPAPVDCSKNPDPYTNYSCLDAYLGTGVGERLWNYYALEMGHASAPSDPTAPPGRIADWPTTPQTTPPMPFTEWPYGGTTAIGVTRPGSVDSPLMVAMANTSFGKWLSANDFQIYGWIDPGMNISSNTQRPGGNAPIAYAYTPNTVQLDQAVIYVDRFPDTVQTDHIDWGMRFSAIEGENYRYTTAYGVYSYQLLKHNNENGYDFPMVYGELYIPFVFHGMMIRVGRYISLPDIEAQLAPNNYMYTHSLTYAVDNYTNTGIMTSTAITKQFILQAGISVGTEAPPWHVGETMANPYPNPLYPGKTFKTDPGAQVPTYTVCARYSWNDEHDNIQPCANGINGGQWGYNNLQWYGFTYYHKFNDHWHISTEFYDEHQNGVPNANNPDVIKWYNAGGTPFSPQFLPFNAPNLAHCSNDVVIRCRATGIGVTGYLNYSPDPLNNFSLRPEYYADDQGQRTGTPTDYYEFSFGWQHWLSPQIEFRPEIGYYRSIDAIAFNANPTHGIAADKNHTYFAGGDVIMHF
jgi:Putative beta-barrel porin-2, OmpL-like. bbp2